MWFNASISLAVFWAPPALLFFLSCLLLGWVFTSLLACYSLNNNVQRVQCEWIILLLSLNTSTPRSFCALVAFGLFLMCRHYRTSLTLQYHPSEVSALLMFRFPPGPLSMHASPVVPRASSCAILLVGRSACLSENGYFTFILGDCFPRAEFSDGLSSSIFTLSCCYCWIKSSCSLWSILILFLSNVLLRCFFVSDIQQSYKPGFYFLSLEAGVCRICGPVVLSFVCLAPLPVSHVLCPSRVFSILSFIPCALLWMFLLGCFLFTGSPPTLSNLL